MSDALRGYVENDLYNELRWLLCAATQWDAYDRLTPELPQQPKIIEPCCSHLKVYTMDSALLHARSLYEFFTATESAIKRNNAKGLKRLTWCDYSSGGRQESALYKKFTRPLHGRVMHLDKDRSGYDEVKKEVVNFAHDILDLWDGFSKKPGLEQYEELLKQLRAQGVKEARDVASQYKCHSYECPFS